METISQRQVLSNRFDPTTGKLYINEKEVSVGEYNRFINLSREEQLREYGQIESFEYSEKNTAVVGEFNGENGIKYEIKSNANQSNTTITEAETQIDVYKGLTSAGGGVVANLPADYAQTEAAAFASAELWQLSNNDLAVAQGKLQEAVAGGNLQDPTYGTGIPSGADLPPGSFGIGTQTSDGGDTSFGAWRRGEEFNKLRQEDAKTTTTPDTPNKALNIEFGKVDKIIRKLHLRNLIYPIDADFGNTQDYMQINQFTYRPPNQNIFFGGEAKFSETIMKGVTSQAPRLNEDFLGLVKLPMPNSLSDSNNVSWGADQLNALTAAVSSAVFTGMDNTISGLLGGGDETGLLNSKKFQDAQAFGRLQQILGFLGNQLGGAFDYAVGEGKTLGQEILDNPTGDLGILGRTLAGSAILNIGQFGVTPETILSRGQGAIPNNNMALLFNSPTLREFTFSWKMTPRSREEAQRVNNIIRFFKQGMAPKKGINSNAGEGSYFLGTPNVFDIVFKTTKDGGNFFFAGDDENNSVLRIKTCACTGAAINYTPDGMWNAYDRGQPVSVTMSLRFAELEPIFDVDYDENVFNYSESRPDLRPVPIDAVGY